MRPAGVIVSAIGHVGAVLMTFLAWETRSIDIAEQGTLVPIEIVAVAPESNVRALAIPDPPEEEAPVAAEETAPEPETAPTPTPAPPERPRPRPRNDDFNLDSIAQLVDKQRQPGRERNEGAAADRNQRGAGLGTDEAVALEDRVRSLTQAHLLRCWRMPIDLPDPDRLVVTVEFELDRNGSLRGQPRVTQPRNYTFDPAMRTAAEAALRAVRQCDPYPFATDPLVGQYYQLWDQLEFTFRPRV